MDDDPQRRCPLCGDDNRCAAAASADPAADCWCRARSFTDAVLATVPASARGSVCLCRLHAVPQ